MLSFETECIEWTLCQREETYAIGKQKIIWWKPWHKNEYLTFLTGNQRNRLRLSRTAFLKQRMRKKSKKDVVICLSGPKESEKQVKKTCRKTEKRERTKEIMEVLCNFHDLYEVVKYKESDKRSYVVINVLMQIFQ